MNNEARIAEIRKANLVYIEKKMRSKAAKTANWPGCPLSHFEISGLEGDVFRSMIADGTLTIIDRPKPSGYTASLVAVAK